MGAKVNPPWTFRAGVVTGLIGAVAMNQRAWIVADVFLTATIVFQTAYIVGAVGRIRRLRAARKRGRGERR